MLYVFGNSYNLRIMYCLKSHRVSLVLHDFSSILNVHLFTLHIYLDKKVIARDLLSCT